MEKYAGQSLPAAGMTFEHPCRRCAQVFSPALDLTFAIVLSARCPHCGFNHGYDNREYKLLRLLEEKSGMRRSPESVEPVGPGESTREHAPVIPQNVPTDEPEAVTPGSFHSTTEDYREPESGRDAGQPADTAAIPAVEIIEPQAAGIPPVQYRSNTRTRFANLRWSRVVAAGASAFAVFLVTLSIIQAIPVSAEEARQALVSLSAREADVVLDRHGRELTRLGVSSSDKITLADFQKWQIDALIFSEDRKFYEHHGVDYLAIFRAMANNVLRLRYAQGASTITQQLARIILQDRKKNIFRKLSEIRLARALENVLAKQKILELYVSHVYLGHGNYSFASAAKFYYNKKVGNLSVNEFLSIVSLIPSPEKYSPLKNNRKLQARMQLLYENLKKAGLTDLAESDWQRGMDSVAEQAERFGSETAFGEKSRLGLWPAQYARDFLMQRKILLPENQNSARVHTTIDAVLQAKAESLALKHLDKARKNFQARLKAEDAAELKQKVKFREKAYDAGLLLDIGGVPVAREVKPQLQAALIALNPKNGEVLAMVGGESFESRNQLNRTVQMRRQTGSAIKPFIYAKATSMHLIHPASLIDDTPYIVGSGSRMWAPENINGGFEGPMPARDALAKSRNIPAIRVGRMLGREAVTELFSDFFFGSETALEERFTYDETVAIGTISLSPLELARGFAVFANNGYLSDPILVTRAEASDRIIDLRKTHPNQFGLTAASKERLLSAAETSLMVSLLKSSGKNSGSGVSGIIGKTGTSSESRDLWFVGGGRDIIVAVWFGFDDMRYALPGATGSALAAKLAGDFLREDFEALPFKMQPGMVRLRVCPLTGRIASENCPHARSEVFLSGVTPEGECLHGGSAEESEFMAVMGPSEFR